LARLTARRPFRSSHPRAGMAVPTFVDRVTLHARPGDGGNGVRLGPPREVQAAGRPGRRQRRPGGDIVLPSSTPTSPPCWSTTTARTSKAEQRRPRSRAAPQRRARQRPRPARAGRHPGGGPPGGEVLADLVGAGSEIRDRTGRPGRSGQRGALAPASARHPASHCSASRATSSRSCLELKTVADVGPRRLPQRGQVQLDRRDVGRAPARRSPTTRSRPGAQSRRRDAPATRLHRRRRPRAHPRRQPRARDWAWSSCATSSAAASSCTCSTARRIEPGRNPVDDLDVIENELRGVRRPAGPASPGGPQQDRRARRRRHRRNRSKRISKSAGCGSSRCPQPRVRAPAN
jgi:GTP-binding protein